MTEHRFGRKFTGKNCDLEFYPRGITNHRNACYRKSARERLEGMGNFFYHPSAITKIFMDARNNWKVYKQLLDVSEGEIWAWAKSLNYLPNSAVWKDYAKGTEVENHG